MIKELIALTAIVTLLTACGGGGGSSSEGDNLFAADDTPSFGDDTQNPGDTSNPGDSQTPDEKDSTARLTGAFVDSAVINIGYRTDSLQGVTDSKGQFQYLEGESITFFIGDLEFPTVPASETVTPLNLADTDDVSAPEVINMLRLLQTLDRDGDAENGITITEAAKDVATVIDFDVPACDFESDSAVIALVANSGSTNTELTPIYEAVTHFEEALGLRADS
ncbi:hypothetical protein [Bacterioplanoides sp.]|uniref:hypothetical protein n=1 Tax=Bacterioplanoides sp. TaxID=2066072 RepID=UPI003B00779A